MRDDSDELVIPSDIGLQDCLSLIHIEPKNVILDELQDTMSLLCK